MDWKSHPKDDPDAAFRRRILVWISIIFSAITGVGIFVRNFVAPVPPRIFITNLVISGLFAAMAALGRRRGKATLLALPIMLCICVMLVNGGMAAGGINAPISALLALLPVMGFCFSGRRLAIVGLIMDALIMAWFFYAERQGWTTPLPDPATVTLQRLVMLFFFGLASYAIGATYEASRSRFETQLVEASRMASLGTMAGGIAHEINNPLTIIIGFANQLQQAAKNGTLDVATVESSAQRIDATAKIMAKIVRGLLIYARDESQDAMKLVSIVGVVDNALSLCQQRFKRAGVQLDVAQVPSDLKVLGHPAQVTQVLANLLNNAFDAVEKQQGAWVAVSAFHQNGNVILSVSDSGPGVPKDLRSKIFAPFFTTKNAGKGTGLGLAISARIVAQHGGELRLDETAQHTTFVVSFPAALEGTKLAAEPRLG